MNFNHLCTHSLLPLDIGITYLAYMMNICGTSWAWLPDQILLWKLPWIPLKSSEWWIDSCGKFSLWLNMPCPPITKLSSLLFKGIQFKFQDLWLGKSKLITDFFFLCLCAAVLPSGQAMVYFLIKKTIWVLSVSSENFSSFPRLCIITADCQNRIYFCIADISAEDLADDCICFPSHGMLMFKWFFSGCQIPGGCGGGRFESYSLWNG